MSDTINLVQGSATVDSIPEVEDETKSPLIPDPGIPGRAGRHSPALDGLRGVAILGVLLFHGSEGLAWGNSLGATLAAFLKCGWMGVDIFFVLSGYLITGILLDTRGSSRYFRSFYGRRILRIFPVYYLLLIIVFVVLPRLVPFEANSLKSIVHRQGWLWTYMTNMSFVFYRKVWAEGAWLDLSHLWSLAVEEQFYLVWPLLVYFLNRRSLKITCFACIVVSFVARLIIWQMGLRTGAIYFPTPCRLDGLAMGGLVALLTRENRRIAALTTLYRWLAGVSSTCLLAVWIVRGGLRFNDGPTIVFAVPAVSLLAASAVGMIADITSVNLGQKLLRNGFLRMSGKYSYGLYLFHNVLRRPLSLVVPAAAIVKLMRSELIGNFIFIVLFMGVSYAVALFSWHAYEKHWLKLKVKFDYRA